MTPSLMMRFLPLLAIIFISACSDSGKSDATKIEKKGREVLTSILKGDASPEKGGITVPGSGKGSQLTLSVSGKKTVTSLPKNLKNKFIAPGVKILSYIRGVDYDTINASLKDSLDVVEIKYDKILLGDGYQKLESTHRDGMMSTKWINPADESHLFLYAYKDGANSRLYIVFTT